jgi:predicted phosphodiesterase
MKIITIGDLHGLDNWKTVDPEKYDKIIFLGDYLDSFTVGDEQMIKNFSEIIALKEQWFDKVILLYGNHEISYQNEKCRATGYRPAIAKTAVEFLNQCADILNIAWQHKNYLWSHAGIHQGFYDYKIKQRISENDVNIAETLQRLFEENYPPIFEIGYERGGGHKNTGGPLWLDKKLLIKKPLRGYHQIAGHSPVNTIKQYFPYPNDEETSVTLCDCLEWGDGKFYELEIPD